MEVNRIVMKRRYQFKNDKIRATKYLTYKGFQSMPLNRVIVAHGGNRTLLFFYNFTLSFEFRATFRL
jgi:hypothetical protein